MLSRAIRKFCNHSNKKLNHIKLYYSMEQRWSIESLLSFPYITYENEKIAFHSLDVELRAPSCHIIVAECGTVKAYDAINVMHYRGAQMTEMKDTKIDRED